VRAINRFQEIKTMTIEKPWHNKPVRVVRHGHFWVPGERVERDGETYQRGPMFVEWETPEHVNKPFPIILVHGGGFQGSEWFDTPDGRAGWAQRLVEAGYAVLVVDRPGHGRSPFHIDTIGPMGPPFSYENGRHIYFPAEALPAHTQWPFAANDDAAIDDFIAGYGPLPADLAASQEMDADRIARLLDRIGPSILLTHSASGPSGWLAADRRPGQVIAIVAVEPMGPPFADIPNIGPLRWGLTAAPLTFDPPRGSCEEVRNTPLAALRVPALANLPILVLTAEASIFAAASTPIVEHLIAAGAAANLLHLPDHGIYGNGHGLIYELNSDDALQPVINWLDATVTTGGT
jgi:pimeloyl-ACP methyl ester carboxylesterase